MTRIWLLGFGSIAASLGTLVVLVRHYRTPSAVQSPVQPSPELPPMALEFALDQLRLPPDGSVTIPRELLVPGDYLDAGEWEWYADHIDQLRCPDCLGWYSPHEFDQGYTDGVLCLHCPNPNCGTAHTDEEGTLYRVRWRQTGDTS